MPVSYTHLDVYKRQVGDGVQRTDRRRVRANRLDISVKVADTPVCVFHYVRDVYKRQEERCIAYFGNEKLIIPMAEVFKVWADGSLELADKCRKTAPVLGGMKDLFVDVKLPDELMRDDTKFCEGLCKLLQLAQTVEATAEQQQVEVGSDLAEMIRCLDRLTDRMIEGGERLWNAPRKMTPEEYDAYIDKSIDAEYSGKHLSERLKLLEELWEDPLVDMQERAEYMETAIKAVQSEGDVYKRQLRGQLRNNRDH